MADSYTQRVVSVLLGLRMLSEGSTYRWDKERTSSSTGEAPVPVRFTRAGSIVDDPSEYERHHRLLGTARTPDELAERLNDAEKALKAAKGDREVIADTIPREPGQLRLYVLIDCAGDPADIVARKTGMSVSWVRMVRGKAGKQPKNGRPVDKWID